MPRLGVTRDKEQLTGLFTLAESKNLEIIPLPLTKIAEVPFVFPDKFSLENIDWLLFTSANGVNTFLNQCKKMNLQLSDKTKIAAIGNKTVKTIEKHNLKVQFIPSESYGEYFFTELIEKENLKDKFIVYARAEKVINDPVDLFASITDNYFPVVCYRTLENICEKDLVEKLSQEDYIFFTSPSNVYSYQHQFGKPTAKLLAIGTSTAYAIEKINWQVFKTLEKPDIEKVLEYI